MPTPPNLNLGTVPKLRLLAAKSLHGVAAGGAAAGDEPGYDGEGNANEDEAEGRGNGQAHHVLHVVHGERPRVHGE